MAVLDLDVVVHSTHLSKNWDKNKQKEYRHNYYLNVEKKKKNPVNETVGFDKDESEKRSEKVNEAEKEFDKWLSQNDDPLSKGLYTIRNEKVSDTFKRIVDALDDDKKDKEVAKHDDFDLDDCLEHFGILGQRKGVRNGPPYPLGSGDHSSAEKKAATKAGINPGEDSGKGSIANVESGKSTPARAEQKAKKAPKPKPETKEQHTARVKAAMNTGRLEDVKKYMMDPNITSDDISNALKKVELVSKLNAAPPKPTAVDKMNKIADVINQAGDWYDAGAGAWNRIAGVMNVMAGTELKKLPIGDGTKGGNQQSKEDLHKKVVQQALASGDRDQIKKYMRDPTANYDELNKALQRADLIDRINRGDYRPSNNNDNQNKNNNQQNNQQQKKKGNN